MRFLFRPRSPLMRLAAGATTAGVAYHVGRRRAEASGALDAIHVAAAPPPAPPAPPVDDPLIEGLGRLASLHASGQLGVP